MADKFPSDKQDKFMLRLPDGMRDKIAQDAKAAGRSMNAEIVARLERSFPPPPDVASYKEKIAAYDELSVRTRYAQMMVSEARARVEYAKPGTPEYEQARRDLDMKQLRLAEFARQLDFVQHEIESLIVDVKPAP